MSDEERLLAAIVDAPDDDAPRLVYADWLQSRSDPRGEFIQLQCQLAAAPDDERRRAIKIVENKLFAAHGAAWIAPLREVVLAANELIPHKFEFSRGFVEEAQLTLDCVPRLAALWERAPLIRSLRLSPKSLFEMPIKQPKLESVFDAPQLARLHTLELHLAGAGNAGARAIARASMRCGLRVLEVRRSVWGEAARMF